MILVTFTSLWSFALFIIPSYILFVVSLILYILPLTNKSFLYIDTGLKSHFRLINSFDLVWLAVSPLCAWGVILLSWSSPVVIAWFGHLIFGSFQYKLGYFLVLNFLLTLVVFTTTHYLTSTEIFDYLITTYHIVYWTYWLFTANSIFTVIFVIEAVNILIFLLVVTSTFSSSFFYKNLNLNFSHLFILNSPYSYLQSLLYLFWVSLISSLAIFLFILFFFISLQNFDWVITEYIFLYLLTCTSFKNVLTLGVVWLVLLFSIFLKCGVAPVYFWKPTFFQGLPLNLLLFYTTFIYFNLLLFLAHFMTLYLGELFYYYILIFWGLIVLCICTLLLVIVEAYYLKIFLAVSSILNSVFVFLVLTTTHTSSVYLIF